MAYKKVDSRKKYSEMEHEQIEFWKKDDTFKKSVENRDKSNSYVFYDGPPFITGVPHYGTLLSSIVKDVVPRYWTMKGKRVERTWGWDCHGLPAENLVEKKLGITDKRGVEKVGLEKYIHTCHTEMVRGGNEWEDTIERIGRWVEFKGAYKTMDKNFMESVWWAFKELYKKGKIYEGEKVLMYCTRCATPISKSEVAMDNSYKDITDPSVYVKFELEDEENTYLLAWTTTPWTLLANSAIAIGREIEYVKVLVTDQEGNKDKLILAKDTVEKVLTDKKHNLLEFEVLDEFKGTELVGKKYKPLFVDRGENAHKILNASYVTTESGTGIVHIAPAYGEEDFELAQKEGVPVVHVVNEHGDYMEGNWNEQNIWNQNKQIAKDLKEDGIVWKIDYIKHEYPHCHRCDTKLMYRAHPSWFMNIKDQKDKMIEENEGINWFPSHIKNKRFKNIITSAPEWNLSRDRFWATPFPVWKCESDKCDEMRVVGSYDELKELSGEYLEDYHRPYVDRIVFDCPKCQGKMKRISKVLDCWFESGSMPFAQFHYPFENKEKFEQNFPGDFIAEYIGQVRAWFYYLHAISIGIFGEKAFKNVIVTGTIAGNDGKKMSKSLGNYTEPDKLLEEYSSDALRFLLMTSPLMHGDDYTLVDKDVADIQRKLGTLWQSYSFFVMYANVDDWQANNSFSPNKVNNVLDVWIIAKLHKLIGVVDNNLQKYDLPSAYKPVLEFIDDLSNWYIRRSRKRFWKSENDSDKDLAYSTLHYVLVELSKVIAPITPFIAEEIYRNLTNKESVHLQNFPELDKSLIDNELIEEMARIREVISEGLKIRAKKQIKVRQPLASVTVKGKSFSDMFVSVVLEELNVKEVIFDKNATDFVVLDENITQELKNEGLAREIIRFVQRSRKKAGFDVDDRIVLGFEGLEEVFSAYKKLIAHEVLAKEVVSGQIQEHDYTDETMIDKIKLNIYIKKFN